MAKAAFPGGNYARQEADFKRLVDLIDLTIASTEVLEAAIQNLPHSDGLAEATWARDHIRTGLSELRKHVDALELIVDDMDWPFPKYSEILAPF